MTLFSLTATSKIIKVQSSRNFASINYASKKYGANGLFYKNPLVETIFFHNYS